MDTPTPETHERLWHEWYATWHDADASKPKLSYEEWLEKRLEDMTTCRGHWKTSYKDTRKRLKEAEKEHAWMRALLLRTDSMYWMAQVEGPWYATGDMEELAFFRALRAERWAVLAGEEKP